MFCAKKKVKQILLWENKTIENYLEEFHSASHGSTQHPVHLYGGIFRQNMEYFGKFRT